MNVGDAPQNVGQLDILDKSFGNGWDFSGDCKTLLAIENRTKSY